MDLNRVMIIGRLTRDPESRAIPSGSAVANFSVATNHFWTDANGARQEKVEYHNVVLWRKLAEVANQYLRKGGRVYIEGRLQTREWEGSDGVKRNRTEIIGESMIMLDGKSADSRQPVVGAETVLPGTELPSVDKSGDEEIKIENIPF
ncbi:MAG: single-stranded DNA-binding protein [Patescibacteria group bacterium]